MPDHDASRKRRPLLRGFQRVLSAFMPKEEDFFTLFQDMSDRALEAAQTFKMVADDISKLDYCVHKVDELEHAGDEIVHEIVDRLNATFVTPMLMDREDILRLAERVDDIIDRLKGVIDRFRTYEITEPTEHARKMGDLLLQATELLRDNMYALHGLQPGRNPYCASINDLENRGDALLKEGLGALFHGAADVRDIIDIIKWKDIYEMMEEALDHCEDAANLVETLVVKNA